MLLLIGKCHKTFRGIVALLFFISCVTFHILVSADVKEQTAEEYRALGYEAQQKGDLNEALSYYTKATSLGAESAVLLNDMGVLYEDIDLHSRAEKYYLDSIKIDPEYLPPYMNLAYFYQRRGKTKQAAQYFKMRYERGDPMDPWAQKAKDELLRIEPKYREWIASLEADALNRELEKKSQEEFYQQVEKSQEHFHKGQELFEDGDYKEALKEYDRALLLSPNSPKIIDARKEVILEMAKQDIMDRSQQAIKRLEVGDTVSARHEIQELLTTIPKEPILLSH